MPDSSLVQCQGMPNVLKASLATARSGSGRNPDSCSIWRSSYRHRCHCPLSHVQRIASSTLSPHPHSQAFDLSSLSAPDTPPLTQCPPTSVPGSPLGHLFESKHAISTLTPHQFLSQLAPTIPVIHLHRSPSPAQVKLFLMAPLLTARLIPSRSIYPCPSAPYPPSPLRPPHLPQSPSSFGERPVPNQLSPLTHRSWSPSLFTFNSETSPVPRPPLPSQSPQIPHLPRSPSFPIP